MHSLPVVKHLHMLRDRSLGLLFDGKDLPVVQLFLIVAFNDSAAALL